MKKTLLVLLLLSSTSALANSFDFRACGSDWRISNDELSELIILAKFDDISSKWAWILNPDTQPVARGTITAESFVSDFLIDVNAKLAIACGDVNEPIPTNWNLYLSYYIKNSLVYNSVRNEVEVK